MWRFSLWNIPVSVLWPFWLTAAIIGGVFHINSPTSFQAVLIAVPTIFVSIIAHELGHALLQRKYGFGTRIMLHAFGGLAQGSGTYSRDESIRITAAGPAVSIGIGLIFLFVRNQVDPLTTHILALHWLSVMIFVNLGWGLLNLLPVMPLDGGQLLSHIMFGRKPVLRAQIGMVAAGAATIFFLAYGQIFGAILFGFLAFANYQKSQGRVVTDPFTGSRL